MDVNGQQSENSMPLVFTVKEASDQLKISRSLLYEQIRAGKVKVIKIGRGTRIRREELIRFLDEQGNAY